jgi:hypothetical protein
MPKFIKKSKTLARSISHKMMKDIVRNLKLNYNKSKESKQLQSNFIGYMSVKLQWEKEEDVHCVFCRGVGEVGESGYFQDREREKQYEKIKNVYLYIRRTQWPCGLRRRSVSFCLLGLWVRILQVAGMLASCECCVLSGTGCSDGLITRPEKSYRFWCVWLSVILKRRQWGGPELRGAVVPQTKKKNKPMGCSRSFNRHRIGKVLLGSSTIN